ncbi:heat shock protein Hsp20 [Halorhabdus utahensis DSM 12940]|uniref:Heat shock protein Hsp20 n=1 Tax=Halorhabdus utahensis (strain DSM 12940 / JCM 11049 / AX-2) TaxID=519442 RepID=C7NPJ0_HALUD|nr:Hsp20/alpha crystallin family protein [Halorhabdus utahensis]ACV12745.1 heat shock protein Hsp20 [Halorhabdus utahensis DSM 12940]
MSALRDALSDLPDAVFADLLESESAYLLVIDVPGATGETVDARTEGNRLDIEARRAKDVPTDFEYVSEERSLFLDVELPLPPDVEADGISGTVDRGVLELTLPKMTETATESIPIEDA